LPQHVRPNEQYVTTVRRCFRGLRGDFTHEQVMGAVEALRRQRPVHDHELAVNYALLVLTTGLETKPENVHDAWSAWKSDVRPDHWSLIPFADLRQDVRVKDQKYVDAIHRAAKALSDGS
jgi:hypothetical protein